MTSLSLPHGNIQRLTLSDLVEVQGKRYSHDVPATKQAERSFCDVSKTPKNSEKLGEQGVSVAKVISKIISTL